MRKRNKVLGFICGFMVIAGTALIFLGYMAGATIDSAMAMFTSSYSSGSGYEEVPIPTVPPVPAVTSVTPVDAGIQESISHPDAEVGDYEMSYNRSEIRKLDVSIEVGRLTLIAADEFRIEAAGVDDESFEVYLDNGTLYIRDKLPRTFHDLSRFFGDNWYHPEINVYVPPNFEAESARFSIAAGICHIEGLRTDKLKIDLSAGDLSVSDVTCDDMQINTSAGSTYLEMLTVGKAKMNVSAGALNAVGLITEQCTVDVAAGTVNISGDVKQEGKFNCAVGRLELQLDRDRSYYDFDIEVGLGNVWIGGDHYSGNVDRSENGSRATAKLEFDCALGDINVIFS